MRPRLLILALALFGALLVRADEVPHSILRAQATSDRHDGDGSRTQVAWSHEVDVGDVPWLRLFFDPVRLGPGSHVELHGVGEGQFQRLNARALEAWNHSSAMFRGGRLRVELHVGPEDRDVELGIARIMIGERFAAKSICDTDDRFATLDNRIGRINPIGCTAWAIGNGAYLTAGHCADLDPDNAGPMLPDGTVDLAGNLLEFNVPASNPDGSTNPSAPNDQYPIDANSVIWRFDGEGQGLGKDWAIFRLFPNSTTNLLPFATYGVSPFRITRETPALNTNMRMTGFGGDAGSANFTQQIGFGPFDGEFNSGPDIWIHHRVDSEGGNSGGPVIWEDLGIAIGIHTNGGCNGTSGNNAACSFEVDQLESAINIFRGGSSQHVDPGHPLRVIADGSLYRPWASVADGVANAPADANVVIYPGVWGFPTNGVINQACTLVAGGGEVYIVGN